MTETTEPAAPNWDWLEFTGETFKALEQDGWSHLHLAPCWEHGPNIYRLSGTQLVPADLGGVEHGYGEYRRKFEIVGDVRDLLGMVDQMNAQFREIVTARN